MTVKPNDPSVWGIPAKAPHRSNTAGNPNPSLGPVGVADRKRKRGDSVVDDEGSECDPFDLNEDNYCTEAE